MCPENQLLQGIGVTGSSEGLSIGGKSGAVGHRPCAWCQLLVGASIFIFSKPVRVHGVYVQFASKLQAGLAGEL